VQTLLRFLDRHFGDGVKQAMAATAVATKEAQEAYPTSAWRAPPPWVFTALKLVLSAVMVLGIVLFADLSEVWRRIANQSLWSIVLAASIIVLQIALGGSRWHAILKRLGGNVGAIEVLRQFYISVFFNASFGGAVGGDLVRAWLSYRTDVDVKTAVNSVILDRAASVAAVALLVLLTLPVFVAHAGYSLHTLFPAFLAITGLVGILVAAQLERVPHSWQGNRLLRGLKALGQGTRMIFLHPASAAPVIGLAVLAQVALSFAAYVIASGLDIHISLIDCLVLMQPVALIAAIPISVGGWGVREAAVVGLFGLVGVESSAALALSVQLGLLSLVAALPGGIFFLLLRQQMRNPAPGAGVLESEH